MLTWSPKFWAIALIIILALLLMLSRSCSCDGFGERWRQWQQQRQEQWDQYRRERQDRWQRWREDRRRPWDRRRRRKTDPPNPSPPNEHATPPAGLPGAENVRLGLADHRPGPRPGRFIPLNAT